MDSTLGSDSLEPEKRTTIDSERLSHRNPERFDAENRFEGENGLQADLEAQRIEEEAVAVNPAREPLYKFTIFFTEDEKRASIYGAEFFGTYVFLLSAYLVASVANQQGVEDGFYAPRVYNIAFGFGISLLVVAACTSNFSGGHLNPAVVWGLFLNGNISMLRFLLESAVQVIAGMAAAGTASALYPGPVTFANAKDASVSVSRALFLEAFGVALLEFTVLFTAIETSPFGGLAYLPIGLSLFLGHMICVPTTGAGLNPARSFGPAIAARSFPGYHWIYWLGPLIGSAVAVLAYKTIKFGHRGTILQEARLKSRN